MKIHTERKIDAAHSLPNYKGKCANLHGHSWRIVVEVVGVKNEETGMLIDFVEIKKVLDNYDHKNINDFLENPTAENLTEQIAHEIRNLSVNIESVLVRVYEAENSYAEVQL
jgi:6-pyruvoyltetrahydropterin/6-carboxytetrahydropterin synthase